LIRKEARGILKCCCWESGCMVTGVTIEGRDGYKIVHRLVLRVDKLWLNPMSELNVKIHEESSPTYILLGT
jgi:hypothetical protein